MTMEVTTVASLYALRNELVEWMAAWEAAETDEDREYFESQIIDVTGDFDAKCDDYAKLIRNVQADVEGYKTEIARLTALKRSGEDFIEHLKARLTEAFEATGRREVRTSIGKWSLRTNPVSCEVTDEAKVPDRFRVPQPDKIDRKALIDWYKLTGEIVDGCEFVRKKGVQLR